MAAGRKVGEVFYEVTADNQVHRGLAAAEGEIQAFKSSVDAMDAKIEVEADLKGLEKDLAEIAAIKKGLEAQRIDIEARIHVDDQAEGDLKAVNDELRQADKNTKILQQRQIIRNQDLRNINAASDGLHKHNLELAKMEENYAKVYTRIQKVQKLDFGKSPRERIQLNRLNAELEHYGSRLRAAGRDTDKLNVDLNKNTRTFRSWIDTIAGTRIHLGFFSTTLRGLGIITATLGPLLLAVAGAAGSLVSVVGAGAVGAFAAGGAALTGFGLAAVGAGFALREPIHQLGIAWKASTAYADAVQKYGKNSSQAKDKQDQLNNSLKGMPPQAQKAVQMLGGMRQQFMKIAGTGVRQDFFSSFAQGIKTAQALLPTFARGTRASFHAMSQGFDQWMKGLRSPEAKNALNDIMQNFAKAVPGITSGLGSLGAMLGRIFQSASHFLPSLTQGFAKWADSLEQGVGKGDQLTQRVGRWIKAMQQVGHFTQAAAASLTTFFSLGTGAGGGFLDAMTRSLNRWNAAMKADPGATRNFFQQGVDTMRQLGPAVGRSLLTLAHLAESFAPALEIMSTGLNALATVASKVPGPILAIVGVLYTLRGVIQSVMTLSLLSSIAGGAGAGGILGRLFGGGAGVAAAGEATAAVEGTTAAMAGAEGAAGGLAAALGPVAIVIGAIVGGGLLLNHFFGDSGNRWQPAIDASRQFNAAAAAIPATIQRNVKAQNAAGTAMARVNKLEQQGKTNTQAYHNAVVALATSQNKAVDAQQQHAFEINKAKTAMKTTATQYTEAKKSLIDMANRGLRPGNEMFDTQATTLKAIGEQLRLQTLNYNRLQKGVAAAGPEMLRSLQQIKGVAGRQTALKFRFDDQQVVRGVGRLSSKLAGLGHRGQVIKILADSKNADQAFARLSRLQLKAKKVRLDAEDHVTTKAEAIQQKINSLKAKEVQLRANDAASAKIRAVQSAISALRDKQVTITTREVHQIVTERYGSAGSAAHSHHYMGGVIPPGFQAGGMASWIDQASARAAMRPGIRSPGGAKITNARYVVGEEAPKYNEFIITENPAYRESNMSYLRQAAAALGQLLLPGYKKGKGKGNITPAQATKRMASNPVGATADDLSGPGTPYYNIHNNINFDEQASSLAQRHYQLYADQGSLDQFLGYKRDEIRQYGDLGVEINRILGKKAAYQTVPLPKGKGKHAQKVKGKVQAYNQAVQSFNDANRGTRPDLQDELRNIPLLQQMLQLDIDEIQQTQQAAIGAQTLSYNQARVSLYRDMGSNISQILGTGMKQTVAALSPSSVGYDPNTVFQSSTGSGLATSGGSQGGGGSQGNTFINNFAAPPPDPFTWTQQQQFTVQAV